MSLVLKTTDISTDPLDIDEVIDNSVGTISHDRHHMVWKDIDIRRVLGDEMYNAHSKFNIGLVAVAGSAVGSGDAVDPDNRSLMVRVSGLPFTSTYDIVKKCNSGVAVMGCVEAFTNADTVWSSSVHNVIYYQFAKREVVDIAIDLYTISEDTYPVLADYTEMLGQTVWMFQLAPSAN
jgi:hypothetical protein